MPPPVVIPGYTPLKVEAEEEVDVKGGALNSFSFRKDGGFRLGSVCISCTIEFIAKSLFSDKWLAIGYEVMHFSINDHMNGSNQLGFYKIEIRSLKDVIDQIVTSLGIKKNKLMIFWGKKCKNKPLFAVGKWEIDNTFTVRYT